MASPKLLAYADLAALQKDVDTITAAWKAGGGDAQLYDARGQPLRPDHPLLARNPGFKTQGYVAPVVLTKSGGLLEIDATAEAALPAATVTARLIVKPVPTGNAKTDQAALSALVPAVDPAPVVKG